MGVRVQRNQPCPCGSGAKYKKCCLKNEARTGVDVKSGKRQYKYEKIMDVGTSNPIVVRLGMGLMEIVDQTHIDQSKKNPLKEVCFQLMQEVIKAEQHIHSFLEKTGKLKSLIQNNITEATKNFSISPEKNQIIDISKQCIIQMSIALDLLFKGLSIICSQQWKRTDFELMKRYFINELGAQHALVMILLEDEQWIKQICDLTDQLTQQRNLVEWFTMQTDAEGNVVLKNPTLSNGDDVGQTFLILKHNIFTFAEELFVLCLTKFLHASLAVYEIPEQLRDSDFQFRFRVGLKPGVSINEIDDSDPILSKIKKSGIQEYHLREKVRQKKFGKVRPIIAEDYDGHKTIAIGNRMQFVSRDYKTFTDFLLEYIKLCFGKSWWFAELKKPVADQHRVMQLAFAVHEYLNMHREKIDQEVFKTELNGDTKTYLTLAYDLYVLNDHSLLQNRVLNRLKHKDQFVGARYELSIIAIFIMAGFEIEFQDEHDGSKKHPEFIAKHKATGQQFFVEAKRRHRRSQDSNASPIKLGITGLLRKAFPKVDGSLPFLVFLDLDLPSLPPNPFKEPWFDELKESPTVAGGRNADAKDIFNMIVFTNFPLTSEKNQEPTYAHIPCISSVPATPCEFPKAIEEILSVLKKYGHVPSFFEE